MVEAKLTGEQVQQIQAELAAMSARLAALRQDAPEGSSIRIMLGVAAGFCDDAAATAALEDNGIVCRELDGDLATYL